MKKVYNEAKTRTLTTYDLTQGSLVDDKLFVARHEAIEPQEEQYHYEILKEHEGGGKEYARVIDTPAVEAKEAYDEYEDIYIFKPFAEKEKAAQHIAELKSLLASTDYQAIKYAEGQMTAAEFAAIKKQRAEWRAEINQLEGLQ